MIDEKMKSKFTLVKANPNEMESLGSISLSFWQDAMRRLRKNKAAMFGFIMIIILIFCAIFFPMEP